MNIFVKAHWLTLQEVLAAAIADFAAYGFDSEERLILWEAKIREAIITTLHNPAYLDKILRAHLRTIFERLVTRGSIARDHAGISRFTLQSMATRLRGELDRRILASAQLIKLNREQMIQKTMQRFSGWATSVPKGGAAELDRRALKTELSKPLRQLPFAERRVLIDQGHKLNASISAVIAHDGGAIAGRWYSHWRQAGYDYREDHKERDGQIYLVRHSWAARAGLVKTGEAGWMDDITQPGQEVFCFPSTTMIPFAQDVEIAYRRFYSGELAEIITSSGKSLSATPNHPILTPDGWAAIGALKEGDNVIETTDKIFNPRRTKWFERNNHNAVPVISQIFGTFEKFGVSEVSRGKREHFHGDGSESNINIVNSAWPLTFDSITRSAQRRYNFAFAKSYRKRSSISSFQLFIKGYLQSLTRLVGRCCQSLATFWSFAIHTNQVRLAGPSDGTSGFYDLRDYDGTRSAEGGGNRKNAFSAFMPKTKCWPVKNDTTERGFLSAEIDLSSEMAIPKSSESDPEGFGDFPHAFPFPTQVSRIVKVNRRFGTTHVYNLQTTSGWYVAEGLITHNCRCKFIYLYNLRQLPDDMLTTKGRENLDQLRVA